MREKNIPFRNYIILVTVLILSIVVVIYFYMWYGEIEANRVNTPIMDDYLSVINYNELDDYLIENENIIIYSSVLDDDTRKFEKQFTKIIDDYFLNGNILYLNLTEESKDKKLFNNIRKEYNIESLPSIVIFKNGKVYDVYSIYDSNYDLNLLVSYLRIEGIIND